MTIAQELEIAKLTAELEELRFQQNVQPFARELEANLGLRMATTHPTKWTEQQLVAFMAAKSKYPTAAMAWLEKVEKATEEFAASIDI